MRTLVSVMTYAVVLAAGACGSKPAHVQTADPKAAAMSPSAAAPAPAAPAPDHSLSAEAYVVQGLPASDRLWSRYEYTRAAPALEALEKRDPALLPRMQSPSSGVVFARLVDVHNLDTETNFGVDAGLPILEASSSLLRTYLAAHRALPSFAHEMAALQVFTVALSARFLPAVLRIEPPKTEPAKTKVEEGKAQIVAGLSSIVDGMLMSLSERATYDHDDRSAMARSFEADGKTVVSSLPRLTRLELCTRLEQVFLSEPLDDIKAILLRAQQTCLSH